LKKGYRVANAAFGSSGHALFELESTTAASTTVEERRFSAD
jgi:hypothetical protein